MVFGLILNPFQSPPISGMPSIIDLECIVVENANIWCPRLEAQVTAPPLPLVDTVFPGSTNEAAAVANTQGRPAGECVVRLRPSLPRILPACAPATLQLPQTLH